MHRHPAAGSIHPGQIEAHPSFASFSHKSAHLCIIIQQQNLLGASQSSFLVGFKYQERTSVINLNLVIDMGLIYSSTQKIWIRTSAPYETIEDYNFFSQLDNL
jgi:hypothetical protein